MTRLAPSPTGALHLGNARTFLVNWAMARRGGWRVVLRVEDLDTPRVKPGVIGLTVDLLGWLGMDWDVGPLVQSADLGPCREAMSRLAGRGLVYPSSVTRGQLLEAASAPQESGIGGVGAASGGEVKFPASMRMAEGERPRRFADDVPAWRMVVEEQRAVEWVDGVAGLQRRVPADSIGDFVVWTNRDEGLAVGKGVGCGQPSYQLAVVVDDARQGVNRVVRGDDLLDSAARQVLIYEALGMGDRVPEYFHVPLVRGADGRRLAKRHGDTRLDTYRVRGVSAERVVGLCAYWSGVSRERQEMEAGEFRDRFDVRTLPRDPVVFTSEDEQWLLKTSGG